MSPNRSFVLRNLVKATPINTMTPIVIIIAQIIREIVNKFSFCFVSFNFDSSCW